MSSVLANIISNSSWCFQKYDGNSGHRCLCIMVCPKLCWDYCVVMYTHCQELSLKLELQKTGMKFNLSPSPKLICPSDATRLIKLDYQHMLELRS